MIVPFGKRVLPLGKTVVVGAAAGVWTEVDQARSPGLVGVVAVDAENQVPHRLVFLGKSCPPIEGVYSVIGGELLPIEAAIKCRRMNPVAPDCR